MVAAQPTKPALPMHPSRWGQTMRRDAWWVQPAATFAALGAFVVYATWAALQGAHYYFAPYLSPLYSPEIFGSSGHAWFGVKPGWWPAWLIWSPAMVILWAPGGFRVTCYYYRGAYYKAFWADPPACTVGEPRRHYRGERFLPLVLQNVHRYFLYLAIPFLAFLAHDVWDALWFPDPRTGGVKFGIGVGTLVLLTNVVLLGGYTFSCHSLRHLLGGRKDAFSSSLQRDLYRCSSCLNRRHMLWAWMSLFWVAFADVYVRLCSMGVWRDWRLF
jgi:hypothetical protein